MTNEIADVIIQFFTTFELDEIQNVWLIACMHNPKSCSMLRDKKGKGEEVVRLQGPKKYNRKT